jgi:hypothetical protein
VNGYDRTMEETPICASVEKDLEITVDELVTGTSVASPNSPAPAEPGDGARQA